MNLCYIPDPLPHFGVLICIMPERGSNMDTRKKFYSVNIKFKQHIESHTKCKGNNA